VCNTATPSIATLGFLPRDFVCSESVWTGVNIVSDEGEDVANMVAQGKRAHASAAGTKERAKFSHSAMIDLVRVFPNEGRQAHFIPGFATPTDEK
jgi:hypothetical protein